MDTIEKQLADVFSHNWWALLVRGLAAILFGACALLMPMISLRFLVMLFGSFILIDGMLGVWIAMAGRREHSDWIALFMWGLAGLGVGIFTFAKPGITTLVLLFFIAIWAITTGVLEIVVAMRLRKEIKGEWLLILGGLLSIAFGFLLMEQPEAGALAMIWLIGVYAVLFGVVMGILAFRMRRFIRQLKGSQGSAMHEKSIADSAV
jgi:uncharacterized membrane protein HdeD (DUF308 family)